jgi:hypothetical protein
VPMTRSAITLCRPITWYRSWLTTGARKGTETGSVHLLRQNPDGSTGPACGCRNVEAKGATYSTPRSADRMPCGLCMRILVAQHLQRKAS